MRLLKILIGIVYFVLLLALVLLEVWLEGTQSSISASQFIYWWLLGGVLYLIFVVKISAKYIFFSAFSTFVVGVIFTLIGLDSSGETIMRLSFLGIVTWFFQTLIENNKLK